MGLIVLSVWDILLFFLRRFAALLRGQSFAGYYGAASRSLLIIFVLITLLLP
jgi:hypothetical protein